jgi:hypothetical protein
LKVTKGFGSGCPMFGFGNANGFGGGVGAVGLGAAGAAGAVEGEVVGPATVVGVTGVGTDVETG